jgi:putative ABC transport system permease protein
MSQSVKLSLTRLILREVQRAKINTALCAIVVLLATGLLVGMVSISRASVDATRVMMKNLGFNLLITPEGVDPARYQALDFQEGDMPEEYILTLAKGTAMAQHLVGKYQKTIQVKGCTVVLTGVRAEQSKFAAKKKKMTNAYEVPEGGVFLGASVAAALNVAVGDTLTLMDGAYEVKRVLDEVGVIPDDIRIFAQLKDVQAYLGRPGRINAIDALACYCPVDTDDILAALKESVHAMLPDVRVKAYKSILVARQKQREMLYNLELAALAIVMAGSATAIWALTYVNVRNRRQEIGVLRALGIPDWRIAVLFFGKIIGYSVVGAVLGCTLGHLGALWLNFEGRPVPWSWGLIGPILLATPLTAILFGLPPVVSGLLQEPSEVLREGSA